MADEIRAPHRPVSPPGRVTKSLLERRWFTLFAELVLIVSGILIALYIDGWVQDRRDRDTEIAYLTLLVEDLTLIEATLEDYVEFESGNVNRGAEAYRAMSEENLPGDSVELQRLLSGLASRRTLNLVSAAYTDLTSTGNLQLIRNLDLRNKIVQFFARVEQAETIIQNNNSAHIDDIYFKFLLNTGITPVAESPATAVLQQSDRALMELLGPEFEAPQDEILSRPSGSRSWDAIRRHVLLRMRVASVGAIVGNQTIDASRELRQDIENELASRHGP